jgi:hypothetical protein
MIQTLATLYESDFAQWLDQTIKLLRENRFSELDLGNLIEEMESLGKSQRSAITSYLTVLLTHLLKWNYQPSGRQYTADGIPKGSWAGSIRYSRIEISQLLKDNPSLKQYPSTVLNDCYGKAILVAKTETGLDAFPSECPFLLENILDDQWLPG